MERKKIIVLGTTGMAGHTISLYLMERGHIVHSFSNTRPKIEYEKVYVNDAMNTDFLNRIITEEKYDYIINCIGLLNQACEKNRDKAIFLNSFLPHFLSESTKNTKTKVIQMSTDCVFKGDVGGYLELTNPNGETFYDKTKALGELNDEVNLTFRNSIIGPDMNAHGIGLFNWFMKQEGKINGYKNVFWTGVTTLTLAKAMEAAMEEGITGLYHLVFKEKISKHNLLRIFNIQFERGLEIDPIEVKKVDKSLLNTRTDFQFKVPSYEEMIKDMYEWIVSHQDIYPHYKIGEKYEKN